MMILKHHTLDQAVCGHRHYTVLRSKVATRLQGFYPKCATYADCNIM